MKIVAWQELWASEYYMSNSLHHQGVSEVSSALKAVVYAPDGLVEAVELPGHPFGLAVQWHPEWLTDQPSMRALFKAFVISAGN